MRLAATFEVKLLEDSIMKIAKSLLLGAGRLDLVHH